MKIKIKNTQGALILKLSLLLKLNSIIRQRDLEEDTTRLTDSTPATQTKDSFLFSLAQ